MAGKFQPLPKIMGSVLREFSGGMTSLRIVSRLVKQDSHGYRKRGNSNVGIQFHLSANTSKRLTAVAKKLKTSKATITAALIHAALPKLEKVAWPSKGCVHCGGDKS